MQRVCYSPTQLPIPILGFGCECFGNECFGAECSVQRVFRRRVIRITEGFPSWPKCAMEEPDGDGRESATELHKESTIGMSTSPGAGPEPRLISTSNTHGQDTHADQPRLDVPGQADLRHQATTSTCLSTMMRRCLHGNWRDRRDRAAPLLVIYSEQVDSNGE